MNNLTTTNNGTMEQHEQQTTQPAHEKWNNGTMEQ
jgi:hypothetical protein